MLKGPVPFNGAYWVVPEKFLAGFYPASPHRLETVENLTNLIRCSIRCVVNLMEETESDLYFGTIPPYEELIREIADRESAQVECLRFPIRDRDVPTRKQMLLILNTIDASVEAGQPVYVHCLGGIGRTGTVVGCYLLRHGLADRESVLEETRLLRIGTVHQFIQSPETEQQRKFVQTWNE